MIKRRNKRKNINALILQNQLKNITLENENINEVQPLKVEQTEPKIVEVITKIKKKGIPKDELINTKRLLCS